MASLARRAARRGSSSPTRRHRRWRPSPATDCRRGPAIATTGSATARACSRSTGRWTGRSRGPRAGLAPGGDGPPRRDRSRRSWRRRRRSPPAGHATGRSRCSSSTHPWDTSRAPDGPDHRLGVLPRPERLGRGHDRRASRPRSSASRPASATASSPGRSHRAGGDGARTTRTTSAATSTPGCRTSASSLFRPTVVAGSVSRRAWSVPRLVVDAARRRRPRDGRLPRRPVRAAPRPRARPRPGRRRAGPARGAATSRTPAPRRRARRSRPRTSRASTVTTSPDVVQASPRRTRCAARRRRRRAARRARRATAALASSSSLVVLEVVGDEVQARVEALEVRRRSAPNRSATPAERLLRRGSRSPRADAATRSRVSRRSPDGGRRLADGRRRPLQGHGERTSAVEPRPRARSRCPRGSR